MKYKLLQKLPGLEIGMILEELQDTHPYSVEGYVSSVFAKKYPDFFEEVKEPKTIYNLKFGDHYWTLSNRNNISHDHFGMSQSFFETDVFCTFVTEREAKRNKLLRELATRQDKWLPASEYEGFITWDGEQSSWDGDEFDIMHYHMGLVFRNEKEYNKYLTEEAKDLLFNL